MRKSKREKNYSLQLALIKYLTLTAAVLAVCESVPKAEARSLMMSTRDYTPEPISEKEAKEGMDDLMQGKDTFLGDMRNVTYTSSSGKKYHYPKLDCSDKVVFMDGYLVRPNGQTERVGSAQEYTCRFQYVDAQRRQQEGVHRTFRENTKGMTSQHAAKGPKGR